MRSLNWDNVTDKKGCSRNAIDIRIFTKVQIFGVPSEKYMKFILGLSSFLKSQNFHSADLSVNFRYLKTNSAERRKVTSWYLLDQSQTMKMPGQYMKSVRS